MNYDKAYQLALEYVKADIPVALWGNPGIGKSALAKQLADEFKLQLIDIRLSTIDPVDLTGFVHKDEASGTFTYLPYEEFPLEDTPLPEGKVGWLLLLDEMNTAPRQNLAAAYKIVLDRKVGRRKLHSRCRIMAAGNLVGGIAGALPAPLVSRFAHIYMTPELTDGLRNILGPDISRFLTNNPKLMYKEAEEPNTPYPTFRTWAMARQYLDRNAGKYINDGLAGIVGNTAMMQYIIYAKNARDLDSLTEGSDPFPLEVSQDLLDFLSPEALKANLGRFVGEWHALAKHKLSKIAEESN